MQSAKLVLTRSVLMVGILLTAAARQIGENKASAAEGAKQGIATTFVMAGKVKVADSFRAATPADSSSTKLIYFSSGKVAAAVQLVQTAKQGCLNILVVGLSKFS